MTFIHPMPQVVAEQFAELVNTFEVLVDEATRPVNERIRERLAGVPTDIVAGWSMPRTFVAEDHEFSGKRARTRQPRFIAYWRTEVVHKADDGAHAD